MEIEEDVRVMAHGTFWQSVSTIAFKLISFVYTIVIARLVSQDQVGVFYFALGIIGMIAIFADAGFVHAIGRYIPYYLGRKDVKSARMVANLSIFFNSAVPLAFSVILFFASGPIASFFGNMALLAVLPWMAAYIFFSQLFSILAQFLVSLKHVKESSIASSLQNAAKLAFTLWLLFALGADAVSLTIASILSFAVATIYVWFQASRRFSVLRTPERIRVLEYVPMLREVLPFGMTMIMALFITNFITYTDRLLIGYFLKDAANAQIAIYSIATGLAGIAAMFATSVVAIFFPIISEMHGRGEREKMNSASATALRWMTFTSAPIAAFFIAFSAPILRLLYGAAYEPGALVLSIFTVGIFASLLGTAQRTALAGMRMLRQEMTVAVITAVLNIALNVALVPVYGINGAAAASAISLCVMAILYQRYAARIMGFPFPSAIWKNVLAALLVTVALWLLQAFAYGVIISLPLSFGGGTIIALVLEKVFKLASLGVFFAIGAALYLLLVNFMQLFDAQDAAVLKGMMDRARFPAWAKRAILGTVFWNQKEFH